MHTINGFSSEWQKRHYFPIDLSSDTPFYYEVYTRLRDIAEKSAERPDESCLFHLLMYIENSASVGIDGYYERLYRSLGDLVGHWCKLMEMDANGIARIQELATQAVADAPASSLQRWIEESVLSGDFFRLNEVALFFARQDATLSLIYPNLKYREEVYAGLTGHDKKAAWEMLWTDLAFNWRDKKGQTLLEKLAERFDAISEESDVPDRLRSVRPERLEAYSAGGSERRGRLTLTGKDGRVFKDVVCPTPRPEDHQQLCYIGQLATYLGTTYLNGPGRWADMAMYDSWNGGTLWKSIEADEKEDATVSFFTTPSGKDVCLYDDLYVYHDGTDDGYPDEFGIYQDEPNLFDFLEWLKPAGSGSADRARRP